MEGRPSRAISLVEIAIEPKTKADHERMLAALARLHELDPAFTWTTDTESGQTILKGISETHLDEKVDLLKTTYLVETRVGAPQVAYRETISRKATIDYAHKKITGNRGQFARVVIAFEPLEPGSGFVFENKVVGGAIPAAFIPGVERGLLAQKESGLLAGFPLIDFKATLLDGAYHDTDSSQITFEMAARAALRELHKKGEPKLLEPWMALDVFTPDDLLGSVIADLNRRRGRVQGTHATDDGQWVEALVPLANMFGYFSTLRSISQGRARFELRYSHYEQVPPDIAGDDPRFPGAGAMSPPPAANDAA